MEIRIEISRNQITVSDFAVVVANQKVTQDFIKYPEDTVKALASIIPGVKAKDLSIDSEGRLFFAGVQYVQWFKSKFSNLTTEHICSMKSSPRISVQYNF